MQADPEAEVKPTPADFETFLPWACYQFEVEATLVITKNFQRQYVSVAVKDRKIKQKLKSKTPTDSSSNAELMSYAHIDSTAQTNEADTNETIFIETTYDENQDLVRIKFLKGLRKIPRKVFKVIGLAIPYHKTLSSIIINHSLDAQIIHEISHYFSKNSITEICLDRTFVPEANYHILLDNAIIKHFSLSRCSITDDVVKTIADKLTPPCPASDSLSALNLSSNRIQDDGVKYLADMLRSNRRLTYLNLANNRITDEGADSIFDMLQKFPLTTEETMTRSKRLMSYIKAKRNLISKAIIDLHNDDYDKKIAKKKSPKLGSSKKKLDNLESKSFTNIDANILERAEIIAERVLGTFSDPFAPQNTEIGKHDITFCLGNNTLSYLNLAFNSLSYCSVKKLCEVLKLQSDLNRKPKGLVNVRIEGNYLPENCPEYQTMDELLFRGLSSLKSVEIHKKRAVSTANRN